MKSTRDHPFRRSKQFSAPVRSDSTSGPVSPSVDLLFQQAVANHQAGELPQAEALYRQVLQLSPGHSDALHYLGVMASQVGKHAIAVELIDHAIQINPNNPEACSNRGSALQSLRQYQSALESFDRAIELHPDYADAWSNRSNALCALRQYQDAVESCDRAIQLQPDFAPAYSNRACALKALQQYELAVASCTSAIQLKPDYAEAYCNRASALLELRHCQAALEDCNRAIQLRPDYAEAYCNCGNALQALNLHQAALEAYDEAILLQPEFAEAYSNRGSSFAALHQSEAALECCDKAILLRPQFAEAHINRASVLYNLQRYQEALEGFDQAFLLSPDSDYLRGIRLHTRRFLCDWSGSEDECRDLEARIDHGEKSAFPFVLLALSGSSERQKKAAEIYVRDRVLPHAGLGPILRRSAGDKIRIGYFSADFRDHAVSYLMANLFERHDRGKFEILGFSFGPEVNDEMTARVRAAMDRFIDIRSMSDRSAAQLSRELEVDIAVDLTGFTRDGRPGIFAERAAPIQVSYLGYSGTMGADFMDYLIADETLVPEASRPHYTEKIAYLPDTFMVSDSRRPIASGSLTRAGQGLPESGFVYCGFNILCKLAPDTFDVWMRILTRVEGSVLWLKEGHSAAADNLRKEAASRGIAPERLIFAGRLPIAEHLARHRLADLFLDTLPYNAHATASDALWTGLPVLTCMGHAFAGRVTASLLHAIDLPELVTHTPEAYESMAIGLAKDPQRLHEIRERLKQNRLTTPLFDTAAFTGHLEAAYTAMYGRHRSNLPPGHIHIARIPDPSPT